MMHRGYDVVVIGSGPNGLAAAIVAARRGLSTLVLEARDEVGGGVRSAELTLPGFVHDVCSTVHPMVRASQFFRETPLSDVGLEWITPPAAAAHPLPDGQAAMLWNSLDDTTLALGGDGKRYRATIGSIVENWPTIEPDILRPLGVPSHPLAFAGFGFLSLLPAEWFAKLAFTSTVARALFAGNASHSLIPLSSPGSAAIGLVLAAVAHRYGWPVAKGGSGAIATALASRLRSLGGQIVTGHEVTRVEQLPAAKVLLFDTSPRAVARIMGSRLRSSYVRSLERYPYGPGVFKVDWALSHPIPWKAKECLEASTVHVGGTLEEIAESERHPWAGTHSAKPFVLVTQPSLFDPTRAPAGRHTAWAYCHVPNGSDFDMTSRIEAQIERFAPGFRDVILARATRSPSSLERENPNLVGGDVGGGSNKLLRLFRRPTWRTYSTSMRGVYLCSAATPPGAGTHGLCGYLAATRAIERELGRFRDPKAGAGPAA